MNKRINIDKYIEATCEILLEEELQKYEANNCKIISFQTVTHTRNYYFYYKQNEIENPLECIILLEDMNHSIYNIITGYYTNSFDGKTHLGLNININDDIISNADFINSCNIYETIRSKRFGDYSYILKIETEIETELETKLETELEHNNNIESNIKIYDNYEYIINPEIYYNTAEYNNIIDIFFNIHKQIFYKNLL